ncbi:MAG: UDP-N-acetylglucosamine 2-epimerase (non-hydrolyzing) [Rhodospirillales bacterium]|nr:MAG: UDP-N-acetylglucosamine 2-epimerase (non-hydrolyzing) [Rhodospirillales bacterium]
MTESAIHLVAGARPNFMKIAPLYHALSRESWCRVAIVHTGQHYDADMSDNFFRDLRLPQPDFHLNVGSGSHAEQTAGVMLGYGPLCESHRPTWTIVVGDVNSTIACALTAAKLGIPVAHLEAGLRSRDRTMPEEINRVATDAIADLLWTPSADADQNLLAEGVPPARIHRVGNIMIDAYEMLRDRIESEATREHFSLPPQGYGVVTLHRPSNVDDKATLSSLVAQLAAVAQRVPLVFPLHPRTRRRLEEFDLMAALSAAPQLHLVAPMSYVPFMGLVREARFAVTDSGGLQEETTYLGIPCLTLRQNTERPITVLSGTNRLIPPAQLREAVETVLSGAWPEGHGPDLWDGHTAGRVVESLRSQIERHRAETLAGNAPTRR